MMRTPAKLQAGETRAGKSGWIVQRLRMPSSCYSGISATWGHIATLYPHCRIVTRLVQLLREQARYKARTAGDSEGP